VPGRSAGSTGPNSTGRPATAGEGRGIGGLETGLFGSPRNRRDLISTLEKRSSRAIAELRKRGTRTQKRLVTCIAASSQSRRRGGT